MKNKTYKQKPQKSRRRFLQSTGMFVAGMSVLRPSILSAGKTSPDNKLAATAHSSVLSDAVLPEGVHAVWDISKAFHETALTRERICINGLWQWQPASKESDQLPESNWGYFKVPGNWPGINNYMMKESQKLYPHPSWENNYNNVDSAWYQREISIPEYWTKRRIVLYMEYVNSSALVFIDGKQVGEILFPSGELDLTSICMPGKKYVLTMKVTAFPLADVVAVYNDSNAPRQGKGLVMRRGLCGDVYLSGVPSGARIADVRIFTSFRKSEITFAATLENLSPKMKYNLRAVITDHGTKVAEFSGSNFNANDLKNGAISMTESWKPSKLWDIHTPQNMFEVSISLIENNKKLLDTSLPSRFGFREFWIDGRDFYLNGTRIYLSTVPYDNAQISAALANYEGAKESMRRLKSFGINYVYTHNYGCEPGTHLSFSEILRAADDIGMLIGLSQPHFGQYDWTAPDADQKNGYARHAGFYVQVAGNHPSVVFYSTSHNSTGYTDDMNPDKIDGLSRPDTSWSQNNVKRALRAEAIISALDPGRIVYHHSSGNLSPMHTSNFYPNWVPIQEMNDWFEHWATVGVKPLMLCEFGAPFTWDWAMYRGWYKGKREFGSAQVPWEFCLAEWNAQFLGEKAYRISEQEKMNLRWEAERFRKAEVWGRSSYPFNFDSRLDERNPVFAMHIADNWRAFRTWGVSINSPWHHSPYWKLREGASNVRKDYAVDWENLQKPGLSADFILERPNRRDYDIAFDESDWIATEGAQALYRNNMPLLAYIAGKPSAFTSKDHNFLPGNVVEKQLIIINNSREPVDCECSWSFNLPVIQKGNKTIRLETGRQERILLRFDLPASLTPGDYNIEASVKFSNGEIQKDTFIINVLSPAGPVKPAAKTALFDPKAETGKLLDSMGIQYQAVDPGDDLSAFEILIIGKGALTAESHKLDVGNVRNGLKVIVFEQTSEVLEKRFGFRVQEYGLRQVYKRISDHPLLAGLTKENLAYWKGDATILEPRMKYETQINVFNGVPTVKWCDMPVTRLWRCGNRGNVASVLIEKPSAGNFTPVVDGGFSLHYSPLMEYREGKGMVLFCQMDITGRTEKDPAAERLAVNIISYVSGWKPTSSKKAVYTGETSGLEHLKKVGITASVYANKKLPDQQVLVIGPGGSKSLSAKVKDIKKWMSKGGKILAIGLDQSELDAILPFRVTVKKAEHIAAYFDTPNSASAFAGICPADAHNRAPVEIPLVSSGADILGDGVLACAGNNDVVLCQFVPWQCDYSREQHNVKQTYRRSSFLLSRLMGNLGIESSTPVLERFNNPLKTGSTEKRWLDGLYVDIPEEWDDPYRFFRW